MSATENPITAADVEKAVRERNITVWYFRDCSLCGANIGYVFRDGVVWFDGRCDCSSAGSPRPSSYAAVADFFMLQTPPIRFSLWNNFLAAGTVKKDEAPAPQGAPADLPCPYCGALCHPPTQSVCHPSLYVVECMGCRSEVYGDTPAAAKARWNTRV